MNVLLIGNGGREHAIALKLKESNRLNKLYSLKGNPGINSISEIADCENNNKSIVEFAKNNNIDLIVCGPEQPLVDGLADMADEQNILVFGPKKEGAILEGSKIYAKQFMFKYNIPTAKARFFYNYEDAKSYFNNKIIYPVVIKADGLAAGKGVKIANNKEDAFDIIKKFFIDKIFGKSGEAIVVEDFLTGEEMSALYLTDGFTFIPLIQAKDYKKIFDGDRGENTGGMGSYAPHLAVTKELINEIEEKIVKPIKIGFKKEQIDYRGVLYIGLMLTDDGPKVIEFNCRFGDPETQVILPLMESDLLDLMKKTAEKKLLNKEIKWVQNYCACVVIASSGYPGEYKKNIKINFKTNPNNFIHCGTKFENGEYYTNGGRVLNAVALGSSKQSAIEAAYNLVSKVEFEGMYYRKDIGK